MFVGRAYGDSDVHALRAGRTAGWVGETDLVPEIGTLKQVLQTAGYIHDSGAIVRIGEPLQPRQELEIALLQAPPGVRLVDVCAVPSEWSWVAEADQVQTSVVLDEVAFQDCGDSLEQLGLFPQVVPSAMSVQNRMRLAGSQGSLILEESRIPAGWFELPGTAAIRRQAPIWYGLAGFFEPAPVLPMGSVVWLAFAPRVEKTGGLRDVLEVFSRSGISLKHLRSFPQVDGNYAFCSTFHVQHEIRADEIFDQLTAQQTDFRVLATFSQGGDGPSVEGIAPIWESVDQAASA